MLGEVVPGMFTWSSAPVSSSACTTTRRGGRAGDQPVERRRQALRQIGRRFRAAQQA